MNLAEVCIALGAMFAFAALILKVVEVARSKYAMRQGGGRMAVRPPNEWSPGHGSGRGSCDRGHATYAVLLVCV
jgi:hypothetical protein